MSSLLATAQVSHSIDYSSGTGCRRELLARTLVWNQAHLRQILRQYATHHNQHRPLHLAAPLKPLPEPVDLDLYRIRKQAHVGGMINEYRLVA